MDARAHREAIGQRFGSRIATGSAVFLAGTRGISGLPCTVTNGVRRPLTGVNRFMLLQVMKDKEWSDPRFFTSHQVKEAGWSISPGAKSIGLQYLISTGDDGLPLEAPEVKRFNVFNATEIAGVPEIDASPQAPFKALEAAAAQAGFEPGTRNLRAAVRGWLLSLQGARAAADPAGAALRVKLAAALLEVQAGLPIESDPSSEYAPQWAQQLDRDPLSFFESVKDAEELAAMVMVHVTAIGDELRVTAELERVGRPGAQAQDNSKGDAGMAQRKGGASERVEAMFAERAAVLAVPYEEKDKAQSMGAVWYVPQRLWFVPKGFDLERFKDWDPRSHSLGPVASTQIVIDEFRRAMESLGLDASGEILPDGKWHNVSAGSKRKKNKAGAYILSLIGGRDGSPTGMINDKYSGASLAWTFEGALLTPEQKARMRNEALAREAIAAKEQASVQNEAAVHAVEIFNVGEAADHHGYVLRKGIPATGMRQVPGSVLLRYPEFTGETGGTMIREKENYLLVPMTDAAGELRAVQAISEDGVVKLFMRGAQKKGTMMVLGAKSFDALCSDPETPALAYAEGVATGASFREASGFPVVVCFDAGNLETVAADTASKVPVSMLPIMAVDNDQFHVERALGFLSARLGVNPHAARGSVVDVTCSSVGSRMVSLGDAIADGEWHQTPVGSYCMSLSREEDSTEIRSVHVEIVPNGERKMNMTFSNRGVEAGRKASQAFATGNGPSRSVTVMPEFKSLDGRPTDWNDLAQLEGLGAIRNVLGAVQRLPIEEQRRGQGQSAGTGLNCWSGMSR